VRVALASSDDDVLDPLVGAPGAVNRPTREIFERLGIRLFVVAAQPLVAAGAADAELTAQLRDRLLALLSFEHELEPLLHGAALFPRHRRLLCAEA
jgi:hypothetical protein